jgi:hypothetical protein
MQSSTFAERATAAVSTLVAIAILGAAVTAQQASTPVADAVADYESDLRYQIDLTLRHDGLALKAAHAGVDNVLAAWRGSPQSATDRRLLLEWFDAAISATMPGHSGKLPPQPEFTSEAPIIVTPPRQPMSPAPAEPTPVAAEPEETTETTETHTAPVTPTEPAPSASEVTEVTEVAPVEPQATIVEVVVDEQPVVESTPVEHSITVAPPIEPVAEVPANPTPRVASAASDTATLEAPPFGATPYEATTEPAAVNVNLAELNARIEGYNQQLAEIEASMVVEGGVSGPRLTTLVEEIEQLAQQYQFVKLYFDSLTDSERRRVSEPRSMSDAISHASRLAAREQDAADFLADFEADDAAATLTDRLQVIAESASVNQ